MSGFTKFSADVHMMKRKGNPPYLYFWILGLEVIVYFSYAYKFIGLFYSVKKENHTL
jgi:hypothetical protein